MVTTYPIFRNSDYYKTVFVFFILLAAFFPVAGNSHAKIQPVKKTLKLEGDFRNIILNGDISVILTNDAAGTVIIEGREKDLGKITHVLNSDTLVINAHLNGLCDPKFTIYLSSLSLHNLRLNGDADIYSNGRIQSYDLNMSLNGNINVKVKTLGNIRFDTPDGIELKEKPHGRWRDAVKPGV